MGLGTQSRRWGSLVDSAESFGLFNLKISCTFTQGAGVIQVDKQMYWVWIIRMNLDEDHTQTLCLSGPYITLLHAVQTNYGVLGVGPMELGYLCGYAHGDRLSLAV